MSIRILRFSSRGHDTVVLEKPDAVESAQQFEKNGGRIVDLKTNMIKDAEAIKENDEVLFLNPMAAG